MSLVARVLSCEAEIVFSMITHKLQSKNALALTKVKMMKAVPVTTLRVMAGEHGRHSALAVEHVV